MPPAILIKDLSSEQSAGSRVLEDHDMDCYNYILAWMFRNSNNGKCECRSRSSNIPYHSVLYVR